MPSATKPAWQQATALVSLSTCGAITGFTFTHGPAADLTSPASVPVHLLALAGPASSGAAPASSGDGALRAAIVSAARHYLRLARTRTPAEMEALIWQDDSTDGADHGPSCAAFASLTLELGATAVGRQSWVTGGGSYPWPLHRWADVRVEPNPASPGVVSMLQDAQAQHRWHPLGDGYRPQPGDWVLFDGHVEVVTGYTGAALDTIGADSLPGLTVNAHAFPAPLAAQGVLGFVDNGEPASTAGMPGTAAQRAFISLVAPGAIAAQRRYGIPAAVTIAQAIDESGWGRSELATADHNLFGIKGTGPAGSDTLPTREYENGGWVTRTAPFRVYHDVAESIEDHSRLLATGAAYRHVMAHRNQPDAFAAALTGVYATDPDYGSSLIALMRRYDLYRFDAAPPAAPRAAAPAGGQQAAVPGVPAPGGPAPGGPAPGSPAPGSPAPGGPAPGSPAGGAWASVPGADRPAGQVLTARRYVPRIPHAVTDAFVATAMGPLTAARPLYQDVADRAGIRWELLAACDWMQCHADRRYSPVHGERLGAVNPDGTVYRTRAAALAQCASDLAELAGAVYLISLTAARALSVPELAGVFAAFRWGGLLSAHGVPAMEFPYSVAGLTVRHLKMRWPDISDPRAPDKPGTRFRMPFGALPVVLSLGYQAVV